MKLQKVTEATGTETTKGRWHTIFVGTKGERFSLYSPEQMPDFVTVSWIPLDPPKE